jgi:hypothetical protein
LDQRVAGKPQPPLVDKESKVDLFRSLFRGREDVYAERFRMKDGRRPHFEQIAADELPSAAP